MAFLDTRTGALIAGDAFQTKGGIAVAGQLRPGFPFPALATWHQRTALESAKKLGKHRPSLLAQVTDPCGNNRETASSAPLPRLNASLSGNEGGSEMSPRIGLDLPAVLRAAAELADQRGIDSVTLASLSRKLSIRPPSLYNHVDGLGDLRKKLAVYGLRQLHDALSRAAVGRSGDDA